MVAKKNVISRFEDFYVGNPIVSFDFNKTPQVAPNGWSEGECKGKAGWFPSAYVDRRDKAPASKVMDTHLLT